jgi:hypothetical protein
VPMAPRVIYGKIRITELFVTTVQKQLYNPIKTHDTMLLVILNMAVVI